MWYLKHFPIGKIGLITVVSSEAMGGVFCVTAEGDLCAVTAFLSPEAVRIRLAVQHELEQFNVTFFPHLISFLRVKIGVNRRRGFQLINCSILFVIREMFYLSCLVATWDQRWRNQVVGTERHQGKEGAAALQAYVGPDTCICTASFFLSLSLANTDKDPLRMA